MKNISLKDAVDIAAKLDLLTRNKTIDPFISVNLFSANAEDEVASRQERSLFQNSGSTEGT